MTCDEWWADISVIFWFLIFVASLLDSNLQWMPHHNKLSGHSKWFLGWIHISVTLIFSYLAHFNAITVWLSYSLRLKNQLLFRLYHLQTTTAFSCDRLSKLYSCHFFFVFSSIFHSLNWSHFLNHIALKK